MNEGIWRVRLSRCPVVSCHFIKYLRIVLTAFRRFDADKLQMRASALTFYTMLSVVPIVAMALAISRGFGLDQVLQAQLQKGGTAWQGSAVQMIFHFAHSMLAQSSGGLITGLGILVLFWTVISMLGNIEEAFNDIWHLQRARTLARKVADYLSAVLVGSALIIASGSVTVLIAGKTMNAAWSAKLPALFDPLFALFFNVLSYVIIWLLFTFTYIFMPNTRVSLPAAFTGGIVAGTLFEMVQWAYIKFQIGVASYNAIYGSFAALPLFLVWLQLSWLIVLFGGEMAHATESAETYGFKPEVDLSATEKDILSLWVLHYIALRFSKGEKPANAKEISATLTIPLYLTQRLLQFLMRIHLVSTTGTEHHLFQPAANISNLRLRDVIDALDTEPQAATPPIDAPELASIRESLVKLADCARSSPVNTRLIDI